MLSESSIKITTAAAEWATVLCGVSDGRAKANTRRRIASVRRIRRRISRSLSRRISCGSRSRRNCVVGNLTSGSRRRLKRWITIGMAAAGSAQRKAGLRNEKTGMRPAR
jgi:hypothetical protein